MNCTCPKCGSKKVRGVDNEGLYSPTIEECEKQGYENIGIDDVINVNIKCDNCGNIYYQEFGLTEGRRDDDPIRKIDWAQLKIQKQKLLEVVDNWGASSIEGGKLMGIVHLIDSIQDHAVDNLKFEDRIVYQEEDERVFQVTWMGNEYTPKTEMHPFTFFTEDGGFESEEFEAVDALKVGEYKMFNNSLMIFRVE